LTASFEGIVSTGEFQREFRGVLEENAGLADAVDAGLEDFAANVADTDYVVGSVVGPDPFTRMLREFQSVIGGEAREQFTAR